MSYIVPMKKPICINCPFRNFRDADNCTLIYLMSDKDSEVTVHVNEMTVSPDCPLVELPTPHGKLIDIRSVEDGKFVNADNEYQKWWNGALESIIDYAPTVIEAEGGTE